MNRCINRSAEVAEYGLRKLHFFKVTKVGCIDHRMGYNKVGVLKGQRQILT